MCKGPFTRSDFKDPILGSKNWTQALRRSDFKVPFLSASFILQEYRMKIEHIPFPSVFFLQNYGSVCQKVIFGMFTRSDYRSEQKSYPSNRKILTSLKTREPRDLQNMSSTYICWIIYTNFSDIKSIATRCG